MKVGIYTGRWIWPTLTGNSEEFKHLPLWYSHYDGQPNFDDWYNGFAFGGWEHPAGKQYAGSVQLCGVNVDLNYFAEVEENRRTDTMNALEELLHQLEEAEAEPDGSYAKVLRLMRACVLLTAGKVDFAEGTASYVQSEIELKLVQAAVQLGRGR